MRQIRPLSSKPRPSSGGAPRRRTHAFIEVLESRKLFAAPGVPTAPTPASGYITNPLPHAFTWAPAANATSYDVYLDDVFQSTVTTNTWHHGPVSGGVHKWEVVARSNTGETTASPEWTFTLGRVHGVDVSQWQGAMDWSKAWNQGARFAFIRASRTNLTEDPQLDANMFNAKTQGLLVGAYHYTLPLGPTGSASTFVHPETDAQNYVNVAGQYMGNGYLRPIVDVESRDGSNESFSVTVDGKTWTLHTWVEAFINKIKSLTGASPIVYTGSDFAQNFLNSATVTNASPDLWIANYSPATDPRVTDAHPMYQGVVGTGRWRTLTATQQQSWDFWQYSADGNGLGNLYGTPANAEDDIDLDVFNGNLADHGQDYQLLKQDFVRGAAKIPTNPSPTVGSTTANGSVLLNWNDSVGAAKYDVYVDDMTTPFATDISVSQYQLSNLAPGSKHVWRVVAKGVVADDDTHVSSAVWTFTVAAPPPPSAKPASPTPTDGSVLNVAQTLLDWGDVPGATHYDVWTGPGAGTKIGSDLTTSQLSVAFVDGVRSWWVVAKNAGGSTTSDVWTFTQDRVAPSATFTGQSPASGAATVTFTVSYADAVSGILASSLDDNDVTVTGPNNYSEIATLVSVNTPGNGSPRTATYSIPAPGGTWDGFGDNGSYAVALNATQVRDVAGNFRPAGSLGSINVNLPTFAYMAGAVLHLNFAGAASPIALAHSGGVFSATRDGVTLNFGGVTSVVGDGTTGDDVLHLAGALPVPMTFANGAGRDHVRVTAGAVTFDADLSPNLKNVDVTIDAGATAIFDSAVQHVGHLTVHGSAMVPQGGNKLLVATALTIAGTLDLKDNDLLVNYAATSPMGAWNGTSYGGGVVDMIRAAHNGGGWDGASGIRTTMPRAVSDGLATLGIAEIADIYGLGEGEFGLYGSETVDSTAILIRYTWAGDANLDGFVDGGDYAYIDAFVGSTEPSFLKGDFNYDGAIDGGDYAYIDVLVGSSEETL